MSKIRTCLLIAVTAATLALAACGEKTAGQPKSDGEYAKVIALIKQNIASPDATVFQPMLKSADGKKSCVAWDVTDSLGKRASRASFLVNQDGNWYFETYQHIVQTKESCTPNGLEKWNPNAR